MFFNRRSRDELHEARIADLKEAHEARVRDLMRLADMLAEQVEYLRAQLGRPFVSPSHPGLNPAEQPLAVHEPMDSGRPSLLHVPEEEEDLRALHEIGHLDDLQLAKALSEQFGTEITTN